MLNTLEKAVMLLLYDKCEGKESVLISPKQIIISLLPKHQLTVKELDGIINNLVLDGYIEVINSDDKGNTIYCVSLKMKGIAFKRDLINAHKNNRYLLLRTIIFAVIGAIITITLRILLS
ncbi:MAG: hypothetical protein AB7S44_02270 [Spirochaetales bacterium]